MTRSETNMFAVLHEGLGFKPFLFGTVLFCFLFHFTGLGFIHLV